MNFAIELGNPSFDGTPVWKTLEFQWKKDPELNEKN